MKLILKVTQFKNLIVFIVLLRINIYCFVVRGLKIIKEPTY